MTISYPTYSEPYRTQGPVSADEAYTVGCPMCGQPPGTPCVYTWPKNVNPAYHDDPSGFRWRSRATQDKVRIVGLPTAVPHNDRRRLLALRTDRGRRLRRMRQLRDWLLAHGDIFEENK